MTVHSNDVAVSVKPLPLQAFWPLQALFAPLQALWPLQALAPGHDTFADAEAAMKVLAANTAAAAATIVLLCIVSLPVSRDRKTAATPNYGSSSETSQDMWTSRF
jgi:hypothetical protein